MSDLTNEPESDSMRAIFDRALELANQPDEAPAEDAPPEVEDGPVDSEESAGELSEETEDAAPADEPVEDVETPPPADEPAPEVSPDDRLRDLAASSQEAVTKLLALEAARQEAATREQPKAKPRVSDTALHLALFGRPDEEEAWKALPAAERNEATRIAREHFAREARYAQDPAARYQDVRQPILEDLAKMVEPLIRDYERRQAEDAFRETVGHITDAADRKRLAEIYRDLPGAKASIAEQRETLKLAALKLEVEKQTALLAKDRQKVDAKKRDRAAVDAAKNKATQAGRGRPAGNQPDSKPKISSPKDVFSPEYQEYLRKKHGG